MPTKDTDAESGRVGQPDEHAHRQPKDQEDEGGADHERQLGQVTRVVRDWSHLLDKLDDGHDQETDRRFEIAVIRYRSELYPKSLLSCDTIKLVSECGGSIVVTSVQYRVAMVLQSFILSAATIHSLLDARTINGIIKGTI